MFLKLFFYAIIQIYIYIYVYLCIYSYVICMFIYVSMYTIICMFVYVYIYRSQVPDLPLGHYATSVITERAHRQYIYLFIYLFIIYLFIYLFILYFMFTFTIKSIKIYTTYYIQIAIHMAFNEQICMLIYVNQNNREK